MNKKETIGILIMQSEYDPIEKNVNAVRFKEEVEKQGFETEFLYLNKFFVSFTKEGTGVKYNERIFPIEKYKMVIFIANKEISLEKDTFFIRVLEEKGLKIKNSLLAIERAKNKIHSLYTLAEAGLPIVESAVNFSEFGLQPFFDLFPEDEYVIKYNQGSLGRGVSYVNSKMSLISLFEMFGSLKATPSRVIVQKYIKESHGIDVRVIATKKRVIAAMKRKSNGFDFRSNLKSGGVGEPFTVTKEMEKIALEALKKIGLDYGGIDFGESKNGPVIYEVNANPGSLIESVTGINVIGEIFKDIKE